MGEPRARGLPCFACGSPECQGDCPEPTYYCPHGTEVPVPGGACDRCAAEDADDTPGYFFESWDEWPW